MVISARDGRLVEGISVSETYNLNESSVLFKNSFTTCGDAEVMLTNFAERRKQVEELLVTNHDDIPLSEAIKTMIENEKLYQTCKNNAQKSVEHLSLTTIAQQWKQLLSEK